MNPELTVVIPTHERPDQLRRTLDRFDTQRDAPAFEVIVVANAGDDEALVAEAIGRRAVQPRLLVASAPGVSAARNLGIQEAGSEVVLFLGDDILPGPDLLREHLDWHRKHPEEEIGVLGHVRWARELHVTPFMRWLDRGLQFGYGKIDGIDAGPGHFYTANVSLKRDFLNRAGGFDEEIVWGYEDMELSYRLSKLGFRLLYNRRADAEHLHPSTLEDWKGRMRIMGAAERRLISKHPEMTPEIHDRMRAAAERESHGRAARLVGVVPPWVPVLGPVVWTSAEQRWLKELAPSFLEGWEDADRNGAKVAVAR